MYSHSTAREDSADGPLFTTVHLQLTHDEDWHDTESPIRNATQRRVSVERVDDHIRRDAVSLAAAELLPEVGDGPALEGKDEEEVYTVHLDGDEASPEDNTVRAVNGDPEQEDADAEFEEDVGDNVGRFTAPPPLSNIC
jgi:hypothetical protein